MGRSDGDDSGQVTWRPRDLRVTLICSIVRASIRSSTATYATQTQVMWVYSSYQSIALSVLGCSLTIATNEFVLGFGRFQGRFITRGHPQTVLNKLALPPQCFS